jgi:general secretion pathway protein D
MRFIKTVFLAIILTLSLSAREQVNVNFSNLEIDDFIKLISKITNTNILVNYKITGTVDFVSTSPVYDVELMGILISVLDSKGYTLIKNGSIYEVVRSSDAAQSNTKVQVRGQSVSGPIMVTQSIKVKGENVDIVAAKIRYLISKTAKLMTMKENNVILITDYPANIETIKKVIDDISVSTKNIVEIIPILHAEIKKLQARLVDISKSIFNDKIDEENVKILIDENINGLIIVGVEKNVRKLQEIIAKLDVESNMNESIQIFSLKNSESKSVLASLTEIISKQTYPDPSLKPNISANEEINAIIAVGDPSVIKSIKLIIDELDKEKYQVYVKARIVNISKSNAESVGIKYGFAAGDVSSSGLYAMSANFGDSSLTGTAASGVLGYLGSIGSAAKSAFALGATLDFLESKGASKSISNPSILCVNNKESSIYVGKTISVSSGTISAGTVGTTSSYKREDVGLTLKIKPRVSSIDKVTLTVETVLENVLDDGSNNATGQPVTSKQEVKTEAILRHGESIVIGGLVKSYDLKSVSKIPLLGDIPWIGEWLFGSTSITTEEDNLVVILTPYVVDKSEKLSLLQRQLGKLSALQAEYDKEVFQKVEEGKINIEGVKAQEIKLQENTIQEVE